MKKMIMIFLALATGVCGMSYGGTRIPERPMAVVRSGEVFKVIYKGHKQAMVNVSIYDTEGTVIFSEDLSSDEGFIRPYNLSLLPKGDYRIRVTDKTYAYSETVSTFDKEWIAQVTKLNSAEEKYLVTIPYQGPGEFAVRIYDSHDQLIYSETAATDSDFAKVYNLKNMEPGSTVQVSNTSSGDEKVFPVE